MNPTMNKVRSAVVLVVCALLATAYGQTATYHHAASAFRIDHPTQWQVIEDPAGTGVEFALDGDVALVVFAAQIPPDRVAELSSMTPDDWAASTAELLGADLTDVRVLGASQTQLAGRPATVVDFEGTSPRSRVPSTGRMIVMLDGANLYLVSTRAGTANLGSHGATFEAMIASFALTSTDTTAPPPVMTGTLPGTAFESEEFAFRLMYPSGWNAMKDLAAGGELTVTFTPPSDAGLTLLLVQPLTPSDVASYANSPRQQLVDDIWGGFVTEVPGAQIVRTYEPPVTGQVATAIDYRGPGIGGTLLFFVRDDTIYTFASVGTTSGEAEVQAALEAMVASFSFTNGGRVGPGAANPIAGPQPARPPLGGPSAPNTLAPVDPFVGTFAGDGLTLTLNGANGTYTGQLVFGDQAFPVTAQAANGALSGTFMSAGTPFAFTVSGGADDSLVLETGGARYTIGR